MKKKKGGNPNTCDLLSLLLTRSQQDDAILSDLSPNVLVNNLTHSLSNCGPVTLSATNGCLDNDSNNNNGLNYLYMPSSRGGKLNKMKNTSDKNLLLEGGCYTCPQGQRGLNTFSRKFIVIIPLLYNKYKKGDVKSFDETVKKLTKPAKKPVKKPVKKPAKKPVKKPVKKSRKSTRGQGGGNLDFTDLSSLDFSYQDYVHPNLECANKYQPL